MTDKPSAPAGLPSLKRKSEWKYEYLPRVALYQDDIAEIEAIFRSRFKDVTLEADGYELETAADLSKLGTKAIHDLRIRGDRFGDTYGWVMVHIQRMYVQLVMSNSESPELLGMGQVARAIMERRKLGSGALIDALRWIGWIPLLVVATLRVTDIWPMPREQYVVVAGALAVLALVASGIAVVFRVRWHGTVYPYPSSDRTTWWSRNRDDLVTQSIAAVVGGLIVLAATWALGLLKLP